MRALKKQWSLASEDEDAKNVRCGTFSLVAGLVMLLTGGVMMTVAHYEEARSELVGEYNQGVEVWNAGAGEEFNHTSWELLVDGVPIPMIPDYEGDSLASHKNKKVDKGLEAYDAVKFVTGIMEVIPALQEADAAAPAAAPASTPSNNSRTESAPLLRVREVALRVTPAGGEPQELPLEPTPLMRQSTRRAGSWKVCKFQQGGYYSGRNHSCTTYSLLEKVCVKVSPNNVTGKWELDARYGGDGCNPRSAWSPYAWRRIHAPPLGGLPKMTDSMRAPFAGTTVRSGSDPYLLAQMLTDGSLIFAEHAAEELATGMILFIVGAVTLMPACFLFMPLLCRDARTRRRQSPYLRMEEEGGFGGL